MGSKKNSAGKELSKKLLYNTTHTADAEISLQDKAWAFTEGYKEFLNISKTERTFTKNAVQKLADAGYKKFDKTKKYKAGDKIYEVNRQKAVIASTIGSHSLEKGFHLSIAHIDSPRLDLKAKPLYEQSEIAYFKTHYYGGIRKYQWATIPLSMHGVVVKSDGSIVEIAIGEEDTDPIFYITDLLPHLSKQQDKRPLAEGIKGEELNIVVSSLPFAEDKDIPERVKLEAMRLINEKYGFTEKDFTRAEIEFVPALKARDVGFDRSLIAAYGQDDKVCSYAALEAELAVKQPKHTSVCVLTDKEEIGSMGNTGLESDYVFHFLEELCGSLKADYITALKNSRCLSADVNAAFDPTFPDVFEKNNASYINHGVVVSKYGGGRGKGGSSDANAEFTGWVTNLLDEHNVAWQIGELGKVDEGGGGTVAQFVANRNIEVIDIGVAVLSMHSPYELTSKLDIYSTFEAFCVFANS